MRKFVFTLHIVILLFINNTSAQQIVKLTVDETKNNIAFPVCVDLAQLTNEADSSLAFYEIINGKNTVVPFQVEHNYHRFLWWMIQKNNSSQKGKRVFVLTKEKNVTPPESMIKVADDGKALIISEQDKNVVQYNYATHYPPAGVDTVFKRSGFIHPLWSPSGNVLTQINPPDHRHHVGIWNPWTHVLFEGREVDFWNLGDKKGTVRFSKFISKNDGAVYGGFKALQEHVAFNIPSAGLEKVALDEVWDVRVFNAGEHVWLWDFTSQLNCATTDTITLEEYRYGGFGFRATPEWNNKNSKVLTSEGKTRKDADASSARWCMIDGDIQNGHSGILFMDHPANYNSPEPMRVWPEDMNGRGDVFFSFSPTRNMSWTLYPHKNYVLKYRMLVYDGTITPGEAEEVWKNFAHPPKIEIQKLSK